MSGSGGAASSAENLGRTATSDAFAHANAHLLVIEPESSRRIDLPEAGTLHIGRDASAEVRLDHKSVSRRHARLWIDATGIHVADEGSHNGMRVNGDALKGPRTLASGDCVSLGEVVLVLHIVQARPRPRALMAEAALHARLAEEIDRALAYGRSLALVAVLGVPANADQELRARLQHVLRPIDGSGLCDDGALLVFLPELSSGEAAGVAARLQSALAPLAPELHVGLATCPLDACALDDLLLGARVAARASSTSRGSIGSVAQATTVLDLDGRRVLLAAPAMLRQFELIRRLAAAAHLPVLITGETGVGKENAAYAVHYFSARRDKPFLPVNCAAIPENLVESTLFGHERGAFSGAVSTKVGLIEEADGGTVFLDEIGELPAAAQAKLLRTLESGAVTRVGDTRERRLDVRIVAASNRDLEAETRTGRFRADLYFRLGAKVVLPPLRARRPEIPLLAHEFLAAACARLARPAMTITPGAMQQLISYEWPGNVRDLRIVIDVLAATVEDDRVEASDLPPQLGSGGAESESRPLPPTTVAAPQRPSTPAREFRPLADELDELMCTRMLEALAAAGGVRTRAAQLLDMPIRTFTHKMKQFGLKG
jgi:two-component system response regulator AtoC